VSLLDIYRYLLETPLPRLHPSLYHEAVEASPRLRRVCSECTAMATWYYMPYGALLGNRAYCDDHVPRGCSCSEGRFDDEGREMPCIEYGHDDAGFRLPRPAPAKR
jgi:hypothetical protein